jgi:hypothetical protein
MKFKKLIVLVIVLSALVIAVFIKKSYDQNQERSRQKAATATEAVVKDVDASSIMRIDLRKGEANQAEVSLLRQADGSWTIPDYYKAKSKKWTIDQLLKNFTQAKGEMRSDSKDVLGDYSLTEKDAVHLEAFDAQGTALFHLLISPNRTLTGQNFMRLASSNRVIVADSDILSTLGLQSKDSKLDPKKFADMQTVKIDVDKVSKIEIFDKKSSQVLLRQQGAADKTVQWAWDPADPRQPVEKSKVETFLRSLPNIYASEVIDPASPLAKEVKPWIRVIMEKDGQNTPLELQLSPVDAAKKIYALRVMPDAIVYQVDSAGIEAIKTDKASFSKT